MINEFRMLVCEWILGFVASLCPNNQEGHFLVIIIRDYFKHKINGRI